MHLKNQPPIFVPAQFRGEVERLSKAALMDLAWDLAITATASEEEVINTFRARRNIILLHRKNAKEA